MHWVISGAVSAVKSETPHREHAITISSVSRRAKVTRRGIPLRASPRGLANLR
jgi:hypothetical protein